MARLKVAVLGACGSSGFAWTAQELLCSLSDHPYFEVAALVAERPGDVGRPLLAAMPEWFAERPLPPSFADLELMPPDGGVLRASKDVRLVISSLPPEPARELDVQLASTGMPVISESPGLRQVDDIPLIVPEINPDHLAIIDAQKRNHNWQDGFVVANPICTMTIIALSLKPILDAFGIERVLVTTLQSLSGAGPKAIPGLAVVDNVIPLIPQEELKLKQEGRKILGRLEADHLVAAEFPISPTCTRVPLTHGHTDAVFVECTRPASVAAVTEAMRSFTGLPQKLGLPSAAPRPILVAKGADEPQVRYSREAGMAVTVGRIRADEALTNGIKYVVSGHNMRRGTFGNTLLNAELLYGLGLVH